MTENDFREELEFAFDENDLKGLFRICSQYLAPANSYLKKDFFALLYLKNSLDNEWSKRSIRASDYEQVEEQYLQLFEDLVNAIIQEKKDLTEGQPQIDLEMIDQLREEIAMGPSDDQLQNRINEILKIENKGRTAFLKRVEPLLDTMKGFANSSSPEGRERHNRVRNQLTFSYLEYLGKLVKEDRFKGQKRLNNFILKYPNAANQIFQLDQKLATTLANLSDKFRAKVPQEGHYWRLTELEVEVQKLERQNRIGTLNIKDYLDHEYALAKKLMDIVIQFEEADWKCLAKEKSIISWFMSFEK